MCEYCEGLKPITPSSWNPERAGEWPGIFIEPAFNIDTRENCVLVGFFIDIDENLEPDASFNFDYCPKCGRNLKEADHA